MIVHNISWNNLWTELSCTYLWHTVTAWCSEKYLFSRQYEYMIFASWNSQAYHNIIYYRDFIFCSYRTGKINRSLHQLAQCVTYAARGRLTLATVFILTCEAVHVWVLEDCVPVIRRRTVCLTCYWSTLYHMPNNLSLVGASADTLSHRSATVIKPLDCYGDELFTTWRLKSMAAAVYSACRETFSCEKHKSVRWILCSVQCSTVISSCNQADQIWREGLFNCRPSRQCTHSVHLLIM